MSKNIVLVDFDGTLVDLYSEYSFWKQIKYGLPLLFKGLSMKSFWTEKNLRKKLAYMTRYIEHGLIKKSNVIQNAEKFINSLDQHPDIIWALVSNNSSEVINTFFDEYGWVKPEIIIGRHQKHKYMKPHPKPVLDALRLIRQTLKINVQQGSVFMVGNTTQDVYAALQAGNVTPVCIVSNERRYKQLKAAGAAACFYTLQELEEYLYSCIR